MLSLLDALLQTPFPRILQTLPINPAMKLALAGERGGTLAADGSSHSDGDHAAEGVFANHEEGFVNS
jgi:hypothetical protein